jgi:hypothetical protein
MIMAPLPAMRPADMAMAIADPRAAAVVAMGGGVPVFVAPVVCAETVAGEGRGGEEHGGEGAPENGFQHVIDLHRFEGFALDCVATRAMEAGSLANNRHGGEPQATPAV